ncbi:MAG: aerotolerance regulator BatC, partial [Flavobacteriaceae bacterium]|nr:aerotolerance regulator BatC [Flavobacteriaceae bacterium]
DKEDQKEGDDKEDDNGKPKDEKDNKEDNKPGDEKKKQQQPQPGKLSPQQVKNLLEAMNNQEKKVQEKINAKKTKGTRVETEKDW